VRFAAEIHGETHKIAGTVGDRAGRDAAVSHGKAIGVPEHQLDWGD